jgi:hypothetical protein
MLPEMGVRKQAESLDRVDRRCMENVGKVFLLTSLGSRAEFPAKCHKKYNQGRL